MSFRRYAAAALALAALVPITHVAFAESKADTKPAIKELPRPTRPRPAEKRDFEPHTVLVRFASGVSSAAKDRALSKRGARNVGVVPGTGYVKVRTKGPAPDVLRDLGRDRAVKRVSLDYRRRITATPNDILYQYGDQTYLQTVRLPLAWDRTKGSTSQVIAVVDTGVNGLHEDLKGRTVGGYNAITNVLTAAGSATDDHGHGSMTAGIAAANTNNGLGIAGVAWTGRIMGIKALDANGSGYDSDIAEGIIWAANHGAKIINLSLGGPGESTILRDAITFATGKGALVVAASGNDGDDTPMYPAAYPEVLAVGATDAAGNLTDFSSWGDWIDVAAPGFGIVSTGLGQDYYIGDGTSFAAPIAAGVAALVRTRYPTLTPAQVLSRMKVTSRDAGPRGIDPYYGHGVLDAYYAVGGTWGTEFAQRALGAGEPNDVPDRATAFSTTVAGTTAMEGDVDWYRYESTGEQAVTVRVTPPAYDPNRPQNVDPMLAIYDEDLRLVGQVDNLGPGGAEALSLALTAGSYYVSVHSYNGAADTRSYTVAVGPASGPLFNPAQATDVGSWPETVAIGDVTGDDRADVLLANGYYFDQTNDYKLFVFAQNADGSLAAPTRYATALQYADNDGAGLALLDADRDGRRDVALATNAGVQIFRQNEAGTLSDTGLVPGTTGGRHLVAADMDADEDTDLVMSGTPGIVQLTHEPDGTFVPAAVTTDGTGEVEVGDVDGDGRTDVVGFQGGVVRVYHRTDTGWNRTDHDTIRDYWPLVEGIEVADVSGDGRADVIATIGGNTPGSRVNVFVQNTTGGLGTPAVYLTRDIPEPVEAADVTGDSRTDVVAAHGGWNTLSVLPQQANGALGTPITAAIPYASHYNVQGLALGDINGDNRTDAVVADYNNGLVVLRRTGPTPGGEQVWVRGATPVDFATGVSLDAAATVTFQRDVDPSSVTSATVRLAHGRTGATVAATVAYNSGTRTATLSPAAALQDNTPYRIVVDGLRDTGGAAQAETFTSTFRTADVAPPPVSGLKAVGGVRSATLSWTRPAITDLDQVIVRVAAGDTAPSGPTAGTAVYAGTGSTAPAANLTAGSNYTFGVWVRDRSGKYSTGSTVRLTGTAVSISSNTTAPTYGGTVTVTGRLTRPDTATGIAGAPVQLNGRRKGTTTWVLVGTATSSSTGTLTFSHKPSWSLDYQWSYSGSAAHVGSTSALRSVGVKTAVSATLSKTSFALGGSVTLSGGVAPNHAGATVYLQRYVSGAWTTVTSRTLSSGSTYAFTIKPSARGTYSYRVYKPADTDHLAGYSATRSFTVY